MLGYIVIPRDRAVTPTSTLAEFVGTAPGPELVTRLIAELNNPRYTVADGEDGDRIEVAAGTYGSQIMVRPHRGRLMGSPGVVLIPLPIRSAWWTTESNCLEAAERLIDIARVLSAQHGVSVAIALTSELRWALFEAFE